MPIYDYQCGHCHGVASLLRTVAQRHDPAICPACRQGALHYKLSAPRTIAVRGSGFRAANLQQQLAGPAATGPGLQPKVKSSVLHQCIGPSCSVCG